MSVTEVVLETCHQVNFLCYHLVLTFPSEISMTFAIAYSISDFPANCKLTEARDQECLALPSLSTQQALSKHVLNEFTLLPSTWVW